MDRDFIVGVYYEEKPYFNFNMYPMLHKSAAKYARSVQRNLAEGPTVLIKDNIYGPVELWPLVTGGEEDSIPG